MQSVSFFCVLARKIGKNPRETPFFNPPERIFPEFPREEESAGFPFAGSSTEVGKGSEKRMRDAGNWKETA